MHASNVVFKRSIRIIFFVVVNLLLQRRVTTHCYRLWWDCTYMCELNALTLWFNSCVNPQNFNYNVIVWYNTQIIAKYRLMLETTLQQPSHIQQIHLRRQHHHHPVLRSIRFDRILGQRIQLLQRIRSSRSSAIELSKTSADKSRAPWLKKKYSRFLAVTLYGISFSLAIK